MSSEERAVSAASAAARNAAEAVDLAAELSAVRTTSSSATASASADLVVSREATEALRRQLEAGRRRLTAV